MDTAIKTNPMKYVLWVTLICAQILVGAITQVHPVVFIISLLGTASAIASAEGWYSTNIIFILYAIGAIAVAWQDKLYGDMVAMSISAAGSCIALFTWRKNLCRHIVKTRKLKTTQWICVALAYCLIGAGTLWLMQQAGANLPELNAVVMTAVIIAEYLFMNRYCETYLMDIIGDAALILIWLLSGNWILAFTCIIDLAFAIYGLFNWQRLAVRKEKAA